MSIDDPRNGGVAAAQLLGNAQVLDPVVTDRAQIDLRSQSKIQNLRRHIGGLEIKQILRERRRQNLAQLADIIGGRSVALFE